MVFFFLDNKCDSENICESFLGFVFNVVSPNDRLEK